MPQDVETAASAGATQSPPPAGKIPPGTAVAGGRYTVAELVRRGPVAEIYRGTAATDGAPVSLHLIYAELLADARIAQAVEKACNAARAIAHKNVLATIDVVRDSAGLMVVTEFIDGSPLSELLARKRELGSAGFAPRGAGNILGGVCNAIGAGSAVVPHGALGSDSVYVSSAGRVKVADFGAAFTLVAVARGGHAVAGVAPEVVKALRPTVAGDVYGAGRLLYELLVGSPLVKGGRRPSEIDGVPAAVDQLVARCVGPADKRPQTGDELKQLVSQALSRPSGQQAAAAPVKSARPSLAQAIAKPAAGSDTSIAIRSGGGDAPAAPRPSGAMNAADPLSNTEERWLISKGKLDYGPFSMAAIAEKIRSSEIMPGDVLVDKDTGARAAIEDNPLLVPLVEAAKQSRDDQRRAQAEVHHANSEKRKGAALYGFIAAAVLVIGLGGFFLYKKLSSGGEGNKGKVVKVKLGVAVSQDYDKDKIKRKHRRRRHRSHHRSGGGSGSADESTSMDFADENDTSGGERLSDFQINNTIQNNASRLIRCKAKYGSGLVRFSVGGNGRIQWVKVDGKRSGGLYHCVNRAMRRIQFPTFDGKRTRGTLPL